MGEFGWFLGYVSIVDNGVVQPLEDEQWQKGEYEQSQQRLPAVGQWISVECLVYIDEKIVP